MTFQSVPDTVAVELRYRMRLKPMENILYFHYDVPYDVNDLEELAQLIKGGWIADAKPNLSADLTLDEVYAKSLNLPIDIQHSEFVIPPEAGSVVVEAEPSNVALCISLRSGLTGRSARGRIYVPGIPGSVVVGDVVTTGFGAAMLNWLDTMRTELAGLTTPPTWVIVSRRTAGAERPTGVTFPVATAIITDYTVASQRGRL